MAKMTKVQYFATDESFGSLVAWVISASSTKVVYQTAVAGNQIIIEGKGLKLEHGLPDSGTITKVSLKTGDGDPYLIQTGFSVKAEHCFGENALEFASSALATGQMRDTKHIGTGQGDTIQSFVGNDILLGRDGDDSLSGGRGKDRMTGGDGSDIFEFKPGFGRDTITDFDSEGGGMAQDYIRAVFVEATISQVGDDTVLNFGGGDVLTLLNVDAATIDIGDFVTPF